MASHQDFVDYVAEQLREAGSIRSRKMFGEYGLYCDDVFFAGICDDQRRHSQTCPRLRPTREPGTPSWWRMWRTGTPWPPSPALPVWPFKSSPKRHGGNDHGV